MSSDLTAKILGKRVKELEQKLGFMRAFHDLVKEAIKPELYESLCNKASFRHGLDIVRVQTQSMIDTVESAKEPIDKSKVISINREDDE